MINLNKFAKWTSAAAVVALSACSTVDVSQTPNVTQLDNLALLPIANYTETPDAGLRASSITQSILHQQGFTHLYRYQQSSANPALLFEAEPITDSDALEWARNTGAHYALSGSVQEWRYKVGVDGEPVAALSFNLIDLSTGNIVWSATGSRSGWSRSSVSGVGQSLIRQLLAPIRSK